MATTTANNEIEPVPEVSTTMLPQASNKKKTVESSSDTCPRVTCALCIMICMFFLGAYCLVYAIVEQQKVKDYKQAKCIVESVMVYLTSRHKNADWKATWKIQLIVPKSPSISTTFTEIIPSSPFIYTHSGATDYVAGRRQVGIGYPCYYDATVPRTSFTNDPPSTSIQWDRPTKGAAILWYIIGAVMIFISVIGICCALCVCCCTSSTN